MQVERPTYISDLPKDVQEAIMQTVYDTAAFGRIFCPDLFNDHINALNQPVIDVLDSKHENALAMAPRGSGKTTWTIIRLMREICWGLSKVVVYCSNTSSAAIMQTENLKYCLTNKLIQKVFGQLAVKTDSVIRDQFSKDAWIAFNSVLIVPRGVGQQVRGLLWQGNRPELAIFDDLENRENLATDQQRKALRTWFFGDVFAIGSEYSDTPLKRIYIDTLKHEDALLKRLYDDPTWNGVRLEACDDDFNPVAPEYMSKERCIQVYKTMVANGEENSFYREYRNQAISEANRQFKPEYMQAFSTSYYRGIKVANLWSQEYKEARKNKQQPQTKDVYKDIVPLHELINIVIIDPAKTIEVTSADTGFIVVGLHLQKRLILIHTGAGLRLGAGDVVQHGCDLSDAFGARYLGVEETSLNRWITEPFKQELRKRGSITELVPLKAIGKKEHRISSLVPWYQNYMVYHQWGRCKQLESQLLSFPASDKWDVMDAAAYILAMVKDPSLHLTFQVGEEEKTIDALRLQGLDRYGFPLEQPQDTYNEVTFI